MKKITLLLLCLTVSFWSYGQCTTFTNNYGNLTMANDGTAETISADNWPDAEYSIIEGLIIGNTYTVTGTNTASIYITIAETPPPPDTLDIGAVITHGASSVNFTATTTRILIFWHLDALCNTQAGIDTLTTIQCTSPSCTCTALSAPDAATGPTPADGAIDVPIDISDPLNPVITGFAWTDNGVATNYDFNIIGVGTANGVSNPVDIVYDWAYNTTYSWSITSTNCLGTITSAEFSFTTEADPALSTTEFNAQLFSIYPNPAQDIISIKTNVSINNVDIFNQLGQRIMQFNANDLTDKTIKINNLNNGIYFMKIISDSKQQTIKFIKE